VLLFDLSAAFDTLDPPLLLKKLKNLNFSNKAVKCKCKCNAMQCNANAVITVITANAKKTKFLLIRGKDDKKWAESSVNIGGEQVNESTALLCGGYNGGFLNECHYMDLEDHSWKQGPSMMTKRYLYSCGIFKSAAQQGRNIVIAAGGYNNGGDLDSVELLDPTTNKWNVGKIYLDFNYILCVCVTFKKVATFWSSRIVINLDLVVMLEISI
jgi:hypothetical protein